MTATTEVVISEKSMLEFLRSDFSGIAVSRISTMRIVFLSPSAVTGTARSAGPGIQYLVRRMHLDSGLRPSVGRGMTEQSERVSDLVDVREFDQPLPLGDVGLHISREFRGRIAFGDDTKL